MQKRTYIYAIVCAMVVIFCSTSCTDEYLMKSGAQTEMDDFSLQEAKDFFTKQIEETAMLSRSLDNKENKTMSPGDFVPDWNASVGSSMNGLACYDIPIAPTYRYKAIYVDERNGLPSAGKVNVYQKLVIVKDIKNKELSQYILTLIPSKACDDKYGSRLCSDFINCADKGGFTGVAVYSCVKSNMTARVSKYKNGERIDGVFLLNASSEADFSEKYEHAYALVSNVAVQKKSMVMTRGEDEFSYDGGSLSEVVIMPEPSYDWGEMEADMENWLQSSRPDGTVDPEPSQPEGPAIPEDDVVSGDDEGNLKPVQSQIFIAARDDKFVIAKLPDRMEKQIGYTCVTAIISFIELAFGENFSYDKNGVLKIDHGAILEEYIKYCTEIDPSLSAFEILNKIYTDGIDLENIPEFVDRVFTTVSADNITITEAIDKGYIIMTTVESSMEDSAHNVAIVGYHTNGDLIYMDSEYGCWREAPVSAFGMYAYVISGVK